MINRYHLLSLVFFILGVVFLALGVLSGEVETGVIVVFPFLVGSGLFAFLGFIFVFIGLLLFMFGFIGATVGINNGLQVGDKDENYPSRKAASVKGGGVIFIGPIPIVFGSSWKIVVVMIVLAIILIVSIVLATRFL